MAQERTIEPWNALLDEARGDGRLVHEARYGPGRAKLVSPPGELHPDVLGALERLGIKRLYSHQTQAVYAAWEGPVIVYTVVPATGNLAGVEIDTAVSTAELQSWPTVVPPFRAQFQSTLRYKLSASSRISLSSPLFPVK